MTDPDAPHEPSPVSANPDLGYYSPPAPGVEADQVDRPYEYVSASTVTSAQPSDAGGPMASSGPSYPPPAYASTPDEPAVYSAHIAPPLPGPALPLGDQRPKGVAITALIVAVVGLVLAFVPATAGFAIVVMIVAFIVSITALASAKMGGKGFAGTALTLSILGGIVAAVVAVLQVFGAFGSPERYDGSDSYADYEQYEDPVDRGVAAPGTDGIPADDLVLAAPVPLTVTETAFGAEPAENSAWFVVIVDNPNSDHIFVDAEVRVRALDAAGAEVATAYGYVTALQGRSAVVLRGVTTDGGTVASVEVTVPDAAAATVSPGGETGSFSVTNVRRSADDEYGTEVSGAVAGRFADDQWNARVAVVARDLAGRIVSGQMMYLDPVAHDGTPTAFSAWFTPALPADATLETYPAP